MGKQIRAIVLEAVSDALSDACIRHVLGAVLLISLSAFCLVYSWVASLGLRAFHEAIPAEPWWIAWVDIPVVGSVIAGVASGAVSAVFAGLATSDLLTKINEKHSERSRGGASRYQW